MLRFALCIVRVCAVLALATSLWTGMAATQPALAQGVRADARQAAVEAEIEEEGGGGPNPLAVDPDLAIWTLVVFAILFAILAKFAWPQIAAAVDERERKIAATIAAAEEKLDEAKRVLAEHEAKLAATAGEIKEMIDEARRDAEMTKRRIEEDGRKAAAAEIERGKVEIGRARDAAVQELAIRAAKAVVELGERVVRDQLQISPEHQQRIVRDALDKLSDAAASRN